MRLRRALRKTGAGVIAVLTLVAGSFGVECAVAAAAFTSASTAATTVSTGEMEPPTDLSASTATCPTAPTLKVSWTASSGPTPTGYTIEYLKGGVGPTVEGSVAGTKTSYSFTIQKTVSYQVEILATLGNWQSALSSPSASVHC